MDEKGLSLLTRAVSLVEMPLSESQLHLLERYYQEIVRWNEKINLLSRSTLEETLLKNFLDSLMVGRFLLPGEGPMLDLGTGGGFPGIPLKIAYDTLNVFLLEASRKKTSFLKHVIRTLQLKGITVLHGRAEELARQEAYQGAFGAVISKAAFKLPQFLTLSALFLAPDGVLLALKGEDMQEEIQAAAPAAAASGLYLSASHAYTLPLTGDRHTILIYKKASRHPSAFSG